MSIDLSTLSPSELDALMVEAAKQKKVRHRQQIGAARKQVAQYAKELGYGIDELFGSGKSEKGGVKFQNPANPLQTWSGRGKRPGWFKDALAGGMTKEQLAV